MIRFIFLLHKHNMQKHVRWGAIATKKGPITTLKKKQAAGSRVALIVNR